MLGTPLKFEDAHAQSTSGTADRHEILPGQTSAKVGVTPRSIKLWLVRLLALLTYALTNVARDNRSELCPNSNALKLLVL